MDNFRHPLGLDALPSELIICHERRSQAAYRRGVRWWVTGSTALIGASLFYLASMALPHRMEATTKVDDVESSPVRDIGLADEFVVESAGDSPAPGAGVMPVAAPSTVNDSKPSESAQAATPPQLETPLIPPPDPQKTLTLPADSLAGEERRLKALPVATLRFDKEPLLTAVTMIADSAGMSYTTSGSLEGTVTGALVGNPYQLLKNLSRTHAYSMAYHDGTWTFASDKAPIRSEPAYAHTYTITNNMLERLAMREAVGSGGGSGEISYGNMLTGQTLFDANYNRMIDDLKVLLASQHQGDHKPAVFLNEDANSLLVVGTAAEHALVSAYLKNFDRPQRAVALEVKLVRTKRNPSSLVGIDWSNGITFDLSGNFDQGKISLDQLTAGLGGAPTGVVLTNTDAQVTLDAIKNDSMTKRISYIEKMTLDNREVVLSNVVEEPVIGDREEVDSESGLRILLSIEKEIIGTVINILPRITADDSIKMRLRLEDSNIVRFKQFFEDSTGGEYPVISKQTYEGPVVVKDGYSLAITGFETTEETLIKNRVPILGDIPLLGKAFGRERTEEERSYLVVFITPRILPDSTSGIDYINRGHHLGRSEPQGPIAGTYFDEFQDLEHYVSGIRRQHDEMMQLADLRGVTGDIIEEARFLYGELEALTDHAQMFFDRGINRKKASQMLDYCGTALVQTHRIMQQHVPAIAVSPVDFSQERITESRSVYQTTKEAAKVKKPKKRWYHHFRSKRRAH